MKYIRRKVAVRASCIFVKRNFSRVASTFKPLSRYFYGACALLRAEIYLCDRGLIDKSNMESCYLVPVLRSPPPSSFLANIQNGRIPV